MNITHLDYAEAHTFVDESQRRGKQVYWDGWDITFFKPNDRAYFAKNGRYVNGKWGFTTVIKPDENGRWRVRGNAYKPTRHRSG